MIHPFSDSPCKHPVAWNEKKMKSSSLLSLCFWHTIHYVKREKTEGNIARSWCLCSSGTAVVAQIHMKIYSFGTTGATKATHKQKGFPIPKRTWIFGDGKQWAEREENVG
jgi:hypothetical protein